MDGRLQTATNRLSMMPEVLIGLTGEVSEIAEWPTHSELLIRLDEFEAAMSADNGPASPEMCFPS